MASEQLDYVQELRRHVGHDPIIMSSACCAVLDDDGRLLLQQRGDRGGPWGLPGGAMEVGETVAECAVRETLEETGLLVEPQELVGVYAGPLHTYDSGDVVHPV